MKDVPMATIPRCQLCQQRGITKAAEYDSPTRYGPWAYLCFDHFLIDASSGAQLLAFHLVKAPA